MDPKYIILLLSFQFAFGYQYPFYAGSRYYPLTSSRRPSPYRSLPVTPRRLEYPVADYDDGYVPTDQVDFNYYDKYEPYKYAPASYIPFYRPREYYIDKLPRKNWDRVSYYDEPVPQESMGDDFDGMYDDSTWYDDPDNAEANRAFLKNLMLAQLYQESKNPSYANRYDFGNEDYNGRKYEYGIPTTRVDENEKVRRYFEENGNDEVKELEALIGKEAKEFKDKEATEKPVNGNEIAENPSKSQSKLSDAQQYFNLQKQLILNNRKSNNGPFAENLRLEKKQIYDPMMSKFFDLEALPEDSATNSIKKLNMIKEKVVMDEIPPTSTTLAPPSTTASTQKLANGGQKEVVLPRPSNPARKPYPEISTRSMNPPSVYDTIKKLLDMEKEAENTQKIRGQPQKRFAITDDPLTAELAQLKKSSA